MSYFDPIYSPVQYAQPSQYHQDPRASTISTSYNSQAMNRYPSQSSSGYASSPDINEGSSPPSYFQYDTSFPSPDLPLVFNTAPNPQPSHSEGSLSSSRPLSKKKSETSPLYHCLMDGCNYITERHHDLKRHRKTKHSDEAELDCPYSDKGCGATGPSHGFKRKDHLRDHCKRVHVRDLPVSMGGTGKSLKK